MKKRKMKSILSVVLAAAMLLTSVPMDAKAAGNVNHVRSATLSASSVEENAATLVAAKAGDGDTSTQWSSDSLTSSEAGASQWLKATFSEVTTIKQIKVKFHVRNIDPSPANVSSFSIKYTDANGELKTAKEKYAVPASGDGYATEVSIVLDEAIQAKDIQLCDFSVKIGSTQWNSVGVAEFEVYSEELAAGAVSSVEELVAQLEAITGATVEADKTAFELPKAPEGYEIELNGADFEQIIGADLSISTPLVDKEVQVSYKVTETATGKTAITKDIPYLVKGSEELKEGVNEKPVVIPEIQEWYAWSDQKLNTSALTKVGYNDDSLEAIVEEFAGDYKRITDKNLEMVKGDMESGMIYFKKDAEAPLGEEGYEMRIMGDGIEIVSESTIGNMYGAQTILQMITQNAEEMPVGQMRDYPRFAVRGLLLDIARKPIGMVMIQEIARTMRYYKMNDFQLHLSDNYIFLENYGKYGTENEAFKAYEAFRLESGLTNEAGESPTATDYSISKAEMQWFIQYERKFGMNIVPEIDMPAHATSFTKIWPELMVQNKVSPLNSNRPLVDHLDVSKPEAVAKIKELFDDYTKGENPTFDSETIVHIGADEFVDNYTAYRTFVNEIVPYVKETNTVRMWGGLTWINDGKTEIVKEAIENVEMNLWSSDWADGKQMYDMGYKLINTIDDYGYMVPNGSMARANSYGDLLNVSRIFNSFEANRVKTRNGYVYLPSGDDQMLGAVFAIWSDNIDKHSNGLTESDLYYRFFDALPFYAEKTWAATGKEKGSAEALLALAQDIGTAPRTDPYDQPVSYGTVHASYDFENGLKDSTKNQRTRMASGAAVVDGALELKGGKSYAMSMFLDKVGNGNELIFDITLTEAAKPGDILFETTPEYGTHDIRIMENGKLGFTRELHNYYFDYEIPVGETVEIRIYAEQQVTYLYVNGELIGTATGKFIHNGIEKKTGITNATFAIPVERIGSETNAIKATIDNVVIRKNTDIKPDNAEFDYPVDKITYKTGSQQPQSGSEGPVSLAFDGNTNTYWHSEWSPSWSTSQLENYLWVEFKLEEATMVDAIRYLPRPGGGNGDITGYRVEGTTDGTTWTTLTTGTWERSGQTWKLAEFEATEVTGLRLVATSTYADSGNNKFASAAELRVRTAVEETPEVTPTPEVTEAPKPTETPEVTEAPKPTETPEATESVTKVFTDVYADWYASYVQYVYDNGLMTGIKGTTEFQPNANITKAQVAQVLYNMEQQPAPENKNVFTDLTDVYEGEWYANAVAWAYATGVVTGDLNAKKFFPNADVTREQLALMMYRYADYKKYDVTANSDLAGLKNAENVSNWAASGVKWAVGAGLISGIEKDGVKDLAPQGNASRAQMAAILQRFCEADK